MGIQPKDGLLRIRRILKVRWVLFVDDEVQVGFMLTGRLFAMERIGASQKRLILLEDCYPKGLPWDRSIRASCLTACLKNSSA